MMDKQILINNLFRQLEKERKNIRNLLLFEMNQVMLVSHKGDMKITMVIKIEKEK